MGMLKERNHLSKSCDNFVTFLKTDGGLGLWRYPTRGQYYVNINVLSVRGAISLDADSWKELVADPRESNVSVYEPVARVSSPHSYIREYVPLDQLTHGACHEGHGPGDETRMDPNSSEKSGHRRGASKLLRSLKRLKHKLMAPKKLYDEEPPDDSSCELYDPREEVISPRHHFNSVLKSGKRSSARELKCESRKGKGFGADSVTHQTVIRNGKQAQKATEYHPELRKSENNHTSTSVQNGKQRPQTQSYPDIIESHHRPSRSQTRTGNDNPASRQSTRYQQLGRKCNLKRQTVIKIPSTDKLWKSQPGLQEMQSFREQVELHQQILTDNTEVCPTERRDSPLGKPLSSSSRRSSAVTDPYNSAFNPACPVSRGLSPTSREMSIANRAMSPTYMEMSSANRAMPSTYRAMSPTYMEMSPANRTMPSTYRAISPANRARSPTYRTLSPANRAKSPTYRAMSPAKTAKSSTYRAMSPANRARSPAHRSMSPANRARSPTYRAMSPANRAKSPTYRAMSLANRTKSPTYRAMSPANRTKSPTYRAMSPANRARSPTYRAMSLANRAMSPTYTEMSPANTARSSSYTEMSRAKRTMSPTYEEMSSADRTTSLTFGKTTPCNRPMSPSYREGSRPKKEMLSANRAISPIPCSASRRERSMSPVKRSVSPSKIAHKPMYHTNRSSSPQNITIKRGPSSNRAKSQGNRSISSANEALSSNYRANSPANRAISPANGIVSSNTRANSPANRTLSPANGTFSSTYCGKSPANGTTSSTNRAMSPARVQSPTNRTKSASYRSISPNRASSRASRPLSPTKRKLSPNRAMSPTNRAVLPSNRAKSPARHAMLSPRNGHATPSSPPTYQESIVRTKTLPKEWRMAHNNCSEPTDSFHRVNIEDSRECSHSNQMPTPIGHNRHLINQCRSYSQLDGYQPVSSPEDPSHGRPRHPGPVQSQGEPVVGAGHKTRLFSSQSMDIRSTAKSSPGYHSETPQWRASLGGRSVYKHQPSRSYERSTVKDEATTHLNRQHRFNLSIKMAADEILI